MSMYSVMRGQASPNPAPTDTRNIFHTREPIVVKIKNRTKFMLDIPAGMEIKLRNNGITRQNNTVHMP